MSESVSIKSRIRNYDVTFVDSFAETIINKQDENSFIIIDKPLIEIFEQDFKKISERYTIISIEGSESNKNLDYCQNTILSLIDKNIRRNNTVVAIGGGIIQDITAFISSVLFRGIEWVFFPTTLLAQADSCIGSKTSINLGEYKNLLGSFYPPSHVYIDISFLETLPVDEIKSGIGEILHYLFIDGNSLADKLRDSYDDVLSSPKLLIDYIEESLNIKKKVIEVDEFDKNVRNIFNYGHTFGHAIESVSVFEVNHGQAVTLGMDIANYISLNLGILSREDFDFMHEILTINMPSFHLREDMLDNYLGALAKDKKNIGKELVCILSAGPGAMRKMEIPLDDRLKKMVATYFDSISP